MRPWSKTYRCTSNKESLPREREGHIKEKGGLFEENRSDLRGKFQSGQEKPRCTRMIFHYWTKDFPSKHDSENKRGSKEEFNLQYNLPS